MADHVLLVADRGFDRLLADAGVTRIGYRPLRDAMRRALTGPRASRAATGTRCRPRRRRGWCREAPIS